MKKISIFLFACLLFLCACSNQRKEKATASPVISPNITTGPSAGIDNKEDYTKTDADTPYKKKKDETVHTVTVIDETGKKQKLRMADVNVKDCGIEFINSYTTTDYSQVSDGHYYFMRSDGKRNYTIYRDKGEEVGRFSLEKGFVNFFIKYGTAFYAIVKEEYEDSEREYSKLVYIDLQLKKVTLLCDLSYKYYTGPLAVYRNQLFYIDKGLMDIKDVYDKPGELIHMDLKSKASKMVISEAKNMCGSAMFHPLFYVDGKVLYGNRKGKKVTLYSYDLERREEEEIFTFHYNKKAKTVSENIKIAMDEDYIYCQEFIIPRKGGEMKNVFKNAALNFSGDLLSYAFNANYIFYVDKKYYIHRIDKKNFEDMIISDMKAMEVKCTDKQLYVKGYAQDLRMDSWDNYMSPRKADNSNCHDLYVMDIEGKNVKKIWKGKLQKGKDNRVKKRTTSQIMKDVNCDKSGVSMYFLNYVTEYSQVYNDHYYYIRKVGKNKYTLYKDKANKVGTFSIGSDHFVDCAKYGSKFYVLLQTSLEDRKKGNPDVVKLAEVNFSTGTSKVLCEFSDDYQEIQFSNNKIYFFSGDRSAIETEKIIVLDLQGKREKTVLFPTTKDENERVFSGEMIDGKLYYGVVRDMKRNNTIINAVTYYRREIETGKDEVLFRYVGPLGSYYIFLNHEILMVEDDSPYQGLYRIVSSDGKIEELERANLNHEVLYKHYVFYIDGKNRIHRLDRRNHKDKIISSIKAMGIDCTRQGLFVREYDEWLDDTENDLDDDTANALYYMDFNGGNIKKLAKAN